MKSKCCGAEVTVVRGWKYVNGKLTYRDVLTCYECGKSCDIAKDKESEAKVSENFLEEHINEIMEYLNDNSSYGITGIVDKPEGEKQKCDCVLFDFEWVDQHAGYCGDDYYGHIYFPLPSGKYLKVFYTA